MTNFRRIGLNLSCTTGLILALGGCGLARNTERAEAAVEEFHKRWNAAAFREVFDRAHLNFRSAQPVEAMVARLEAVKTTYGGFKSAQKRSWGFNSDDGNADVRLSYDSTFEQGNAVEEFVFRMTGDTPLLLSYDIARPEVAAQREEERKAAREATREAGQAERKAAREAKEAERKAKRDARNP